MAKDTSLDDLLKEYEAQNTWEKPSPGPKRPKTLQNPPETPSSALLTEENEQRGRLPKVKDVDQAAILSILDAIANFDPGTVFDEFGSILSLDEMPLATRVCIKSIKVKEVFEKIGNENVKVGEIKDVQFWDKMSANELLGKFKKMFNDQAPQQVNNILIVDSLKRGLERLQEVGPASRTPNLDSGATPGVALRDVDSTHEVD